MTSVSSIFRIRDTMPKDCIYLNVFKLLDGKVLGTEVHTEMQHWIWLLKFQIESKWSCNQQYSEHEWLPCMKPANLADALLPRKSRSGLSVSQRAVGTTLGISRLKVSGFRLVQSASGEETFNDASLATTTWRQLTCLWHFALSKRSKGLFRYLTRIR